MQCTRYGKDRYTKGASSKLVNQVAESCLGYTAEQTGVLLLAWTVMSNRWPAVGTEPDAHLVVVLARLQRGGSRDMTMAFSGEGYLNRPSDGSARAVLNHWGVFAGSASGQPRNPGSCCPRETCNGSDDDCDGTIDEGCGGDADSDADVDEELDADATESDADQPESSDAESPDAESDADEREALDADSTDARADGSHADADRNRTPEPLTGGCACRAGSRSLRTGWLVGLASAICLVLGVRAAARS